MQRCIMKIFQTILLIISMENYKADANLMIGDMMVTMTDDGDDDDVDDDVDNETMFMMMMAALPSCSVRCFFSEFETNDDTIILVLFRSLDTPQVFNLNNKSVSWVRSMDSHILTVDRETFISDHRSYPIYNRQGRRYFETSVFFL